MVFLISGDDEMGQHLIPTNKPVPQEPKLNITSVLSINEIILDIHIEKEKESNRDMICCYQYLLIHSRRN